VAYLDELVELPPFELWIVSVIAEDMAIGLDVALDVISIITPSSDFAIAYQSMWAFENHVRMASAKNHLLIVDFGVAATFEQECCSHSKSWNQMLAFIEYVGWIEKIFELDYGRFQTIVLFCNWVVANYFGSIATVKWDEYGFTLVNFE
jgi:hypothetical protein